jgi:hypothetical protein
MFFETRDPHLKTLTTAKLGVSLGFSIVQNLLYFLCFTNNL